MEWAMKQTFKVIPVDTNEAILTLHPKNRKKLVLEERRHWTLCFGTQKMKLALHYSKKLSSNHLALPHPVIRFLKLPITPEYELIRRKHDLIIGPYIGILAAGTNRGLLKSLDNLMDYCKNNTSIQGAIVAFSLEGTNRVNHTIRGYLYNGDKHSWEPGLFNYPAAIFKKTEASRKWVDHFESIIENRIFNSKGIDKWKMHQLLSHSPNLKTHLPETIIYREIEDFHSFLSRHSDILVKPIDGSWGKDIRKISRKSGGWDLNHMGKKKKRKYNNEQDLLSHLKNKLIPSKYIIQRGIDLLSINKRLVDFRVIMVKDRLGKWRQMGFVTRFGKTKSIVTNISAGGLAEKGEITLKNKMNMTDEEVFSLKKTMYKITYEICKTLDGYGHYGNLGIDMALDTNNHLWIIEVNNNNPDPTIALDMRDEQLFQNILLSNMLYAKKLAGF
ncbi:YheC/YheD family protein [Ammoniphilus sp. 3BR4]|uniref:YheC/YheD family endospore coat-associated protein n=1 Tax=Ammoniphilus sp. 3BR4 TaxID=3158265 RepID=UPI0034670E31